MNKNKPSAIERSTLSSGIRDLYKRYRTGFYRPNLLLTLEKRQMFDGAAGALLADDLVDEGANGAEESLPTPVETTATAVSESSADSASETVTAAEGPTDAASDTESVATDPEGAEASDQVEEAGSETDTTASVENATTDSTPALESVSTEESTTALEDQAEEQIEEVAVVSTQQQTQTTTAEQTDADEPVVEVDEQELAAAGLVDTDVDTGADAPDALEEDVTQVVFIDTSVEGYEWLLNGVLQEVAEPGSDMDDLLDDFIYEDNTSATESQEDDVLDTDNDDSDAAESPVTNSAPQSQVINGTLIVLLDPNSSAMEQISSALLPHTDLASIHIVSHGNVGQVRLGNTSINGENIEDFSTQLSSWGSSLADDGDILLYGCEVGANGEGVEFLNRIAELTQGDIAASDDLTGNAASGGDWELEIETGVVETQELLNEENTGQFVGVLGTDSDGVPDGTDLDSDNDGILDSVEGGDQVVIIDAAPIPAEGGSTVLPHNVIDLSNLGFQIGDTVDISDVTATGDLNGPGANETITLTFNPLDASEQDTGAIHTNSQSTTLVPVTPAVALTVTVIDIGGGTAGIVIAGSSTAGVGDFQALEYSLTISGVPAGGIDTDGDGIEDRFDLDSDNDGISDLVESGADASVLDADGNGTIDIDSGGNAFADLNSDGVADVVAGGTTPEDFDGDSIANYRDLDSDNDRIADAIEAQPTAGYQVYSTADSDSDGIVDIFDSGSGHGGAFDTPEDTDSDGSADYVDLDSDNDRVLDILESGQPVTLDNNFDGIADGLNASFTNPDGDVTTDPLTVLQNVDTTPGEADYRTLQDTDGDGIADAIDQDDDNDGISDLDELAEAENGFDGGGTAAVSLIYDPVASQDIGLVNGQPVIVLTDGNITVLVENISGTVIEGDELENASNGVIGVFSVVATDASGNPVLLDSFTFLDMNNFDANTNPDPWIDVVAIDQAGSWSNLTNSDGANPLTPYTLDAAGELAAVNDLNANGTSPGGGPLTVADVGFDDLIANGAVGPALLNSMNSDLSENNFAAQYSFDTAVSTFNLVTADFGIGNGNVANQNTSYDFSIGFAVVVSTNPVSADGILPSVDLDTDDDGISDLVEAGVDPSLDTDGDGVIDAALFVDIDSDGIHDGVDTIIGVDSDGTPSVSSGQTPLDTDSDGIADFVDIDSDNDGIVDTVEADPTAAFEDPSTTTTDADSDGVLDVFDTATESGHGGDFVTPEDTDSDGVADFLDSDSDNDGLSDIEESGLGTPSGVDSDNDGLSDNIFTQGATLDPSAGIDDPFTDLQNIDTAPADVDFRSVADADSDGIIDTDDIDDDNDGILDTVEGTGDTDSDGIADFLDIDSDNDGITDNVEAQPTTGYVAAGTTGPAGTFADADSDGLGDPYDNVTSDGLTPVDTDSDGIADYIDTDADADGIPDSIESGLVPSGAGAGDADSDGLIDDYDVNAAQWDPANGVTDPQTDLTDTDSDAGTGGDVDYRDTDSDNDGIPDSVEGDSTGGPDTDSDGAPDFRDTDADNDGIPDSLEGNSTGGPDTDNDGTPDFQDTDADNDGIPDSVEGDSTGGPDTDSDGTPDFQDTDADNDGIPDSVEGGSTGGPDTDSDGTPDFQDTDADNDGIPDSVEGNSTGGPDTDSDGTPDFRDTDADNDGIPDSVEGNSTGGPDTDSDGTPDFRETDSDNDGIPDSVEGNSTGGPDSDSDGTPDFQDTDADNDGIPDSVEGNSTGGPDTDSDGTPDFQDTDADNDGIPDSVEGNSTGGPDTDSDGTPDFQDTDADNDGIPDSVEGNSTGGPDTDSDGTPDFRETDSDNDGIPDSVERQLNGWP